MSDVLDDHLLIEQALDAVEHIRSSYKAADVLGVSDSTVRRYRDLREKGLPYPELRDDTRDAFLGVTGQHEFETRMRVRLLRSHKNRRHSDAAVKSSFDPDAPYPVQLLQYLTWRTTEQEVAEGLVHADLIASAYVLARRYSFTRNEYELLDYWRNEIIDAGGGFPASGPLEKESDEFDHRTAPEVEMALREGLGGVYRVRHAIPALGAESGDRILCFPEVVGRPILVTRESSVVGTLDRSHLPALLDNRDNLERLTTTPEEAPDPTLAAADDLDAADAGDDPAGSEGRKGGGAGGVYQSTGPEDPAE